MILQACRDAPLLRWPPMKQQLPTIVAIALGGAIGAVARWVISSGMQRVTGVLGFPVGTFTVNMLGCLAIGFCYVYFEHRGTAVQRNFITVGVLGALTTFSTYSIESIALMQRGMYSYAVFNLVLSVVLGLAAAILGIAIGKIATGS